ncbi:MAG: IS3 family transposase [Treponema sp.]|jgi:transposase InsO family protein|nr:IS3 family transposase [Treponema sp.]
MSQRRSKADAELEGLIRRIQEKRHSRYGSPRVKKELRNSYGKRASDKKAVRLTRENGLNAKMKRRFIPATNSNHGLAVSENILNRQFHVEQAG